MPRHFPDCPFKPASWPFFYGWFILIASAVGIVSSVPGQTMGVSAFTDPLISSLAIDRTMLSVAYMIGTVGSAFLLTWGGRLYDRYGARATGCGAALVMGFVLLYLSQAEALSTVLAGIFGYTANSWSSFFVLACGFLVLRFSGQGMLTMVSRNMLMKWFDHRRGLANGFMAIVVPVVFSMSPLLLHTLIQSVGWRGAWLTLGCSSVTILALFILVFYRDNPEACGLTPDGGVQANPGDPRHDPVRDWSLKQARRTRTFWVYNLALSLHALYITAQTFHIVSIFDGAGIGVSLAYATLIPASVLTVVVGFAAGWISDHIRLGYLLGVLLGGMALSMCGILLLGTGAGVVMIIVGNGIGGGTFGLLGAVTWPRFFGRTHLGAISGFQMSWAVGFSAVGPFLFGLSHRFFGDYRIGVVACLGFLGILALQASVSTPPPKSPPEH
ncbi:MAG: MFS transporter [Verrucomicrobiota bacterium]